MSIHRYNCTCTNENENMVILSYFLMMNCRSELYLGWFCRQGLASLYVKSQSKDVIEGNCDVAYIATCYVQYLAIDILLSFRGGWRIFQPHHFLLKFIQMRFSFVVVFLFFFPHIFSLSFFVSSPPPVWELLVLCIIYYCYLYYFYIELRYSMYNIGCPCVR